MTAAQLRQEKVMIKRMMEVIMIKEDFDDSVGDFHVLFFTSMKVQVQLQ